jgi:hypothetical protein
MPKSSKEITTNPWKCMHCLPLVHINLNGAVSTILHIILPDTEAGNRTYGFFKIPFFSLSSFHESSGYGTAAIRVQTSL